MKMIALLGLLTLIMLLGLSRAAWAEPLADDKRDKILGLYVHQHWPYNHPYAARTWTVEDWRGFMDGLHKLGYNTVKIWPVLETMPDPLTPSDEANLDKIRQVIDIAHESFGMKVFIALCPNVIADSAVAKQAEFEKRHFFHSDLRVNPGDPKAMADMIAWREKLLTPLAKMDGLTIIDSDPGGYPDSNNDEYIALMAAHRALLDKIRPGIELIYWSHASWPGYCRFYNTGVFAMGEPEEFIDTHKKFAALDPEPWCLAAGKHAEEAGLADRVITYEYGSIEGEPSFPLTNFGTKYAYEGGSRTKALGVMGNAQTHCVQLPNIFAFARGAKGLPAEDADYVAFANDLIPGQGQAICNGWQALATATPEEARRMADELEAMSKQPHEMGSLGGLLFGSPERFLADLAYELRFVAARNELCAASASGADIKPAFKVFTKAAQAWQARHGYEGQWWMGEELQAAVEKMNAPEIEAVLHPRILARTPFGKVKEELYRYEVQTSEMIAAMIAASER